MSDSVCAFMFVQDGEPICMVEVNISDVVEISKEDFGLFPRYCRPPNPSDSSLTAKLGDAMSNR